MGVCPGAVSFNVSLWNRIVIDGDESAYAAYKKVMHRMHPGQGCFVADTQRLQAAKEEWDKAEADKGKSGKRAEGYRDEGIAKPGRLIYPVSRGYGGDKSHSSVTQVFP